MDRFFFTKALLDWYSSISRFIQLHYNHKKRSGLSQKVIEKKDHFLVELKIIPTYELTMLIMGWGPEVEVMQPKHLKKQIFELHKKCVEKLGS